MLLNTNKNTYIVTTSLPYVNSIPHVGFAMEAIISDIIARYLRFINKKVIFVTGTDDNSFKLVSKAIENGEETQSFVNRFANHFLDLKYKLGLSYDVFYRTNSESHRQFVNNYINSIDNSLIYKKRFRSYFCQDCESFVGINVNKEKKCPFHNKEYTLIDEENYFFKVDEYKNKIYSHIESKMILPLLEKKNSIEICSKFSDFNFTRANKFNWGIVYKNDQKYVFYSFFDALLGYLGAIKNIYLNDDVCIIQNIGRDILKFHSVYFPYMMFISNQSITPDYLLVHGFVNLNGEKMSKSKGNIIPVDELLSKFNKNIIRIYLVSKDIFSDFDFSYNEIDFVSKTYDRYTTNFATEVISFEGDTKSDFFENCIEKFLFHKIVDYFTSIVNNNQSFTEITQAEKSFLKSFSKIFIIN